MSRNVNPDAANVASQHARNLNGSDNGGDARSTHGNGSAPLPRTEHPRRRAKTDRGLPPDEELAKLATAYLERQKALWPQLFAAGLLPVSTPIVIGEMVTNFKDRHRSGKASVEAVTPFQPLCQWFGGAYARYSCDNSSPLSVTDQLTKCLDKAKSEGRFIPWEYIFADYSVTGLDASRQGYTSYKSVLANSTQLIETTYIDDFSRASRDEIEWWRLAHLSRRLNKRMLGASDGFNVNSHDWDLQLSMYSMFSRFFMKQLREKVRRGMQGAAARGTCLGRPSLGFTKRMKCAADGTVVTGPDGLPIFELCIDPATRDARLLIVELFVDRQWSFRKIARHFCELKIDGWNGWTSETIKGLIWSPTAIGVFIWNKFRTEFNFETEKRERVKNPRKDWTVKYNRSLAIVPIEKWKAGRKRLAALRRASPLTGRKPSRNEASATTLFSGTLRCSCGAEIKLIRSTPTYKQMGCTNGTQGLHDCKLSCSKTVRDIEDCLLRYIRDELLTDARIDQLVAKANEFLAEEAKKPFINTGPLKAESRKLESKVQKLVQKIEDTDDAGLS